MKCAAGQLRAPEEERAFLRIESRGNYQELRASLLKCLEADAKGATPIDIGFIGKGKGKQDKGEGDGKINSFQSACGKSYCDNKGLEYAAEAY